jgi:hypothetical protein
MGKAKSHSGNLIDEAKPQGNVVFINSASIAGVWFLDSWVAKALVRSQNSRYTLFLRHYVGHESDPSGGFPVEN